MCSLTKLVRKYECERRTRYTALKREALSSASERMQQVILSRVVVFGRQGWGVGLSIGKDAAGESLASSTSSFTTAAAATTTTTTTTVAASRLHQEEEQDQQQQQQQSHLNPKSESGSRSQVQVASRRALPHQGCIRRRSRRRRWSRRALQGSTL